MSRFSKTLGLEALPAMEKIGASVMEAHKDELQGYDTSKGTNRFTADNPLPATLATKLVKARIAENEARGGGSAASGGRER